MDEIKNPSQLMGNPVTLTKEMISLTRNTAACPEEYYAWYNMEMLGYLRLRWGYFSVKCPDEHGQSVLMEFYGDRMTGQFEDKDRPDYLEKAKEMIAGWHNMRPAPMTKRVGRPRL